MEDPIDLRKFGLILLILFGCCNLMKPVTGDSSNNGTLLENSTSLLASNESQLLNSVTVEQKRQFVKEMMVEAWSAYKRSAWGHGELEPIAKSYSWMYLGKNSGLSIVASMSTLLTMGMTEEFKLGQKWIENELDLKMMNKSILTYDLIVNYVGGLLSCYAMTNEQVFLDKAVKIAELSEPAFNTTTGLPTDFINPNTSVPSEYFYPKLSRTIGFKLDFVYLSDSSGKPKFRKQVERIQNFFKNVDKSSQNLYPESIDTEGKWVTGQATLFGSSSEFYTSLVKSFIQSNLRDRQSIEMYKQILDTMEAAKMFGLSPGGLTYARDSDYTQAEYRAYMLYEGCYLGAMLSMGAKAMQRALELNKTISDSDKLVEQNRISRHWELAENLTETCQRASAFTKTGLAPSRFYFNETQEVIPFYHVFINYYLSAEFAESNFFLWRLTHKQKYRDNAWQMVQAIHRHCRLDNGGGFVGVLNVDTVPTEKKDQQFSGFLSSTLKYLYLTFTDDSVLPLDQWVFNSAGHPLPIWRNNTMYPTCGLV